MAWGAFSSLGTGPLVQIHGRMNSKQYKDQILAHHFVPYVRELTRDYPDGRPWYMQQDNAPVHTAKKCKRYLAPATEKKAEEFRLLDWPSQSPDLNPIENIWTIIKRELYKRNICYSSPEAVFAEVQNIWDNLGEAQIAPLIESMVRRVHLVIANKGGPTKY